MHSRENIDAVLELAAKDFEIGEDINKALVKKLEENPLFINQLYKSEQLIEFLQGKRKHTWLQYEDKDFKYCANKIEGSQLIVGNGPRNIKDLDNLFDDIVFEHNIENIICLGNTTKDVDFYDYYSRPSGIETEKYSVLSKIVEKSEIVEDLKLPGYIITDLTITNKLTKEIRHLTVNNFMIPDNHAMDVSVLISTKQTKLLAVLLKIQQTSLTKSMFVHCKYGVGRSGFMIFLLRLLEKYDDIFNSHNDVLVARNIHKLLNEIRKNRPALVTELTQFKAAIRGAFYLRKYWLQLNKAQSNQGEKKALEMKGFGLKLSSGRVHLWPSQDDDLDQIGGPLSCQNGSYRF